MTQHRPLAARATLRLAALMALAIAALSLAAMGLQYRLVQARMMQASQVLLTADLNGFAALYEQRRIIALRQAIDYRTTAGTDGEMLLLQDRNGVVLAGTEAAWPAEIIAQGEGFSSDQAIEFSTRGSRWLGVARTLPGGFPLLVAHSLAPLDATLASLRRGMMALGAVLALAGAAVGWLAARGVMARIGRINTLADRVAAGDLAARLPGPRSADEFGLLETHVHAMLDRIEAVAGGGEDHLDDGGLIVDEVDAGLDAHRLVAGLWLHADPVDDDGQIDAHPVAGGPPVRGPLGGPPDA